MSKSWLRGLFSRPSSSQRTTTRKRTRQKLDLVTFEDRITPAFTIGVSPTSQTILEGSGFTYTGNWTDTNTSKLGDPTPVSISVTPNVAFGGKVSAPGTATVVYSGTVITNFPNPGDGFRFGTWSWTPSSIDGDTLSGDLYKLSTSVTNGTADPALNTPELFNLTVQNVAPTVTAASNQVAISGKPMNFAIGSFVDPGADANWTVQIDWDYDGVPANFTNDFTDNAVVLTGSLSKQSNTYGSSGSYTVGVRVTDIDNAVSSIVTFTVTVDDDVSPTFVDDNWSGNSPGDDLSGGKIYGYNAWSTIQDALDVTSDTGTVNVFAGTYNGDLLVSKAVSLVGPNTAVAGNALLRAPEAEIVTDSTSPLSAIVTVLASDVSISGFLINGDSAAVGLPVYSGADANALYAITNGNTNGGTALQNLTVENNIIQQTAIGFFGNSDTDPSGLTTLTRMPFS